MQLAEFASLPLLPLFPPFFRSSSSSGATVTGTPALQASRQPGRLFRHVFLAVFRMPLQPRMQAVASPRKAAFERHSALQSRMVGRAVAAHSFTWSPHVLRHPAEASLGGARTAAIEVERKSARGSERNARMGRSSIEGDLRADESAF